MFLLLPLQVPKSRQCCAALQKCNSSLNSSSFQMSPTRSSTIFPFKHTYSTIPRGHSTTTTYLCSLCIKVCFIGQKEFSQRLASYFVFSCVHQQGYLGLQACKIRQSTMQYAGSLVWRDKLLSNQGNYVSNVIFFFVEVIFF